MKNVNFKVDTSIASILGENYRSTEHALKELIDNSWDADSEQVEIQLPEILSGEPIIIKDNGSGMTEAEVEHEYLYVANSRTSRKGDTTPQKNRKVKGRKGIGKFAGLVVANKMELITIARNVETRLVVNKEMILKSNDDFEKIDLELRTKKSKNKVGSTEIILTEVDEKFNFPCAEKLKQILMSEYGRVNDFKIFVNGKELAIEDLPGETYEHEVKAKEFGVASLKFTITDGSSPLKKSGIVIRVGGKIVGEPTHFGLKDNEEIPNKLLKRIYGEVEADGLADSVTADWGAIVENSKAYKKLIEKIAPLVEKQIRKTFNREVSLARARLKKRIKKQLEKLPEHKREFASQALEKILSKYYDDSLEKIDTIISVVLDTLERDEYFEVLSHIENAKHGDVDDFAEALSQFGMLELSMMSKHASYRVQYLDYLDELLFNKKTLEKEMHKAIENNLWILGHKYSLISSDKTLKRVVENYTNKKYSGKMADKRPDLLLSSSYEGDHLLIEFKRPSKKIDRDDMNQAEKYRDELISELDQGSMDIIVIGGSVDDKLKNNKRDDVKVWSYKRLVSRARKEIDWLLKDSKKKSMVTS